jgi:hypothetical protein
VEVELIPVASVIPYERQKDDHSCGAAALAMVYRSLGREATQDEIWEKVGRKRATGQWDSRTYLLCQDAIRRGLVGLIIQAQPPGWKVLEACQRHQLRVILHHRVKPHSTQRHFSVLLDLDDESIVLHDPLNGPEQRHGRAAFLELWGASGPGQQPGSMLVALADPAGLTAYQCPTCNQPTLTPTCGGCDQPLRLEPAAALGCADRACAAALWSRIHCPSCDRGVSLLL